MTSNSPAIQPTIQTPQIYLSRGNGGCALAGDLGGIAIVIDALRASTTIAALFTHGIARVTVVAKVEDALALAKTAPEALLIGERGGERVPGFHLGNSPLEVLASPRLDGRMAIFTSSNGAQRLTACRNAMHTLVGSVANATVLAAWTRRVAEAEQRAVVLIAAGQYPDENFISPEDEATAAYLAGRIGLPISAESRAAFQHWEREIVVNGLATIYRGSRHAQRLMEIGYGNDVVFCSRVDTSPTLPMVTSPVRLEGRQIGVVVEAGVSW